MAKKRIIIVCGAGFATSTAGEAQVQKIVKELNLDAEILKRQVRELKTQVGKVDLYVLMTPVTLELNAPKVNGVSFISGVGKQATIQEIKDILLTES